MEIPILIIDRMKGNNIGKQITVFIS